MNFASIIVLLFVAALLKRLLFLFEKINSEDVMGIVRIAITAAENKTVLRQFFTVGVFRVFCRNPLIFVKVCAIITIVALVKCIGTN